MGVIRSRIPPHARARSVGLAVSWSDPRHGLPISPVRRRLRLRTCHVTSSRLGADAQPDKRRRGSMLDRFQPSHRPRD